MNFGAYSHDPTLLELDLLAIFCFEKEVVQHGTFLQLDQALDGLLSHVAREEGFLGREKQSLLLHTHGRIGPSRLFLQGLGRRSAFFPTDLRGPAGEALRRCEQCGQRSLGLAPPELPPEHWRKGLAATAEGVLLGDYRFERYRREKRANTRRVDQVRILLSAQAEQAIGGRALDRVLARAACLGRGVCTARDLVNEPPALLDPDGLARRAVELAGRTGLEIEVLLASDCEKLGMGCLLGVGRGGSSEPRLLHMTYRPAGRPVRSIALIGKGITFDSGGLNLKTPKGMKGMKSDMAGAAAVIGAMEAISEIGSDNLVHGVLPLAENMPSGNAMRPGDILTAMDGTTVEVRNTDGEGRLILADAIAYARDMQVDEIIEISTLTGACMVALGRSIAAAMSSDEDLIERFLAAASRAGEKFWRLPMARDLHKEIEGEISELKNMGSRWGAAIQGGLFLEVFARDTPFVHLDIAGPAVIDKEQPTSPKGGTGFGVLSLAEYVCSAEGPQP